MVWKGKGSEGTGGRRNDAEGTIRGRELGSVGEENEQDRTGEGWKGKEGNGSKTELACFFPKCLCVQVPFLVFTCSVHL